MSARASHASDFRVDVAIIGGGLAGIGCALALERTGLSVALFERSDTLGGRARSCHEATTGDVIDIGPHILLSEYHNMLDMLEHLGTREQVHWEQDRFITLLDGQQHLSMKLHRLPAPLHLVPSLLKVPALSLRDKLSNARMTWLALRASEQELLQLDQLNGAELLERCGVNARFRDWFWKTATLALLNIPLAECSAAALVRMYGQLIGVSAYRSGMPKRPLGDLFAPDAMQRLSACGTRIELNAEVRRIHAVDGRLKNLELMDGRRITPSLCVSAIPPQDLHKLVRSSRIADTAWARNLTRFDPCPYLSTYLWLDRKVTQDRFWSRIWSPDDLNSDFYDLSNIRADIEPSRSLIASNSIYSTQQSSMSDAEIIEKTRQELVDYAPSAREARVQHAVVHRIDMAIPCPRPGTETARPHTQTPLKGLLIAGDWTRTRLPACMESAVYSGRLAAEHVAAALAQPITAVLPLPHPDVSVRLLRALAPAGPSIERLITSTSRRASATRSARLD